MRRATSGVATITSTAFTSPAAMLSEMIRDDTPSDAPVTGPTI